MASIFDHYNLAFDRMFMNDRTDKHLNPPNEREDTRTDEELRTAIAEKLDTEVLEPEDVMHLAGEEIGERENLFRSFREKAANAIDVDSKEAYESFGRIAAEIVRKTMQRDV